MENDDTLLAAINGTPHVATNGNGASHVHVNGNGHANGNGTGSTQQDDLPRSKRPIHAERHMRIACIGAGASGLLLAYKLQRSFDSFELVLYEKNEQISGTWYENRYPGYVCSRVIR